MPPFRPLAVALVAALLLLPTACGGDDEPTRSPATETRTGPVDPTAFIDELLEAIDAERSVHLSVEAPLLGSGEVDVEYDEGGSKIRVIADTLDGPRKFVIAGSKVYVEQPDGGQYSVIDQDDPSYGSLLTTFGGIGPHDSIEGLGEGIDTVARAGTMAIDGRSMQRYRVSANPSRASGALKALAGTSNIADALVFDFYVDEDGLIRQIETEVSGEPVVVKLSRWGKKVDVHVPSGEELVAP